MENDPEIIFIRKNNGGIVSARNKGLEISQGQFIMFVDQDDICFHKVIEKALAIGLENDYDIVFWSTKWLLKNGEYKELSEVYYDRRYDKNEITNQVLCDILFNVDNKCISYMGNVWAAIYSRKMIQRSGITFKRFVDIEDDYLFIFDSLLESNIIYTLKDVGYSWRYNPESETYRVKYINNIVDRYYKFFCYIKDKLISNNVKKDVIEKFETFFIQDAIVRSFENEYTIVAKSKKGKKSLNQFYKDNRKIMKKESVFNYNKRRKRIFILLSHDMLFIAKAYIYLDSLYRKIRKH